jgi:hypothetical protein
MKSRYVPVSLLLLAAYIAGCTGPLLHIPPELKKAPVEQCVIIRNQQYGAWGSVDWDSSVTAISAVDGVATWDPWMRGFDRQIVLNPGEHEFTFVRQFHETKLHHVGERVSGGVVVSAGYLDHPKPPVAETYVVTLDEAGRTYTMGEVWRRRGPRIGQSR